MTTTATWAMLAPQYQWRVNLVPQHVQAQAARLRAPLPDGTDATNGLGNNGAAPWRLLSGWRWRAPRAGGPLAAWGAQPDAAGWQAWWLTRAATSGDEASGESAGFSVDLLYRTASGPGEAGAATDLPSRPDWVPVLTGFLWQQAHGSSIDRGFELGVPATPAAGLTVLPSTVVLVPRLHVAECQQAQGRWQPGDDAQGARLPWRGTDWVLQGLTLRFAQSHTPNPSEVAFAPDESGTWRLQWREGDVQPGFDWSVRACRLRRPG
ncbi:hypothetical protein AACH06_25380 [Ideonella sp. DXS29W]|uniref:Uncharacterized protein n=1 Tax=Ideonella lacteola TaxID=2984193 RepID=A0ABU9BZB6_9BURK